MYEHIVAFKLSSSCTTEKLDQLVEGMRAFKDQIPGIVELTAGINETGETSNIHGFTVGLRVSFENEAALKAYGPHPVHQQFVKSLEGLLEQVIVIDYPIY